MEKQIRRYPFVQLDVFSSRPLEGNPLAVFVDGRGLSDAEMQAVAREMNLSETTFIVPRDAATERERGIRVRIFTVEEELPFAGHPTLGTATVLRERTGAAGDTVNLDLNVGRIPVVFHDKDEGAFGEMRQRDPQFGALHLPEDVARATGISLRDLDSSLPIQTVSTGVPFAIVPLRSLQVAQGLKLDDASTRAYLERTQTHFFYFVSRETVDPAASLHARMIFYNGEDPATGSAAGCCAAWAVAHGVVPSGQQAIIEQGLEIHRPSRIYIRADKNGDRIVNVRVGGYAVEVIRGELVL